VSVTVRRPTGDVDRWPAIPGETRWVDYSHHRVEDDLVVYAHTFRRVREGLDRTHDVLLWKPSSTGIAQRYAAGEWSDVVDVERSWPPYTLERVPRRRRAPRAE
jgi:hypothetical protein